MKHNFDFEQCSDENPFCVPDRYFEEFNKRIEKLITHRRPSFTKRLRQYRYVAAAAAAVLILVAGTLFVESYLHSPQNEQQRARVRLHKSNTDRRDKRIAHRRLHHSRSKLKADDKGIVETTQKSGI